jgi:nucleotide-binding universal stress UspA family protein
MYNRILIATDGSDLAGHAVEHGLHLAKSVGANVVLLTVTELWSPLSKAGEAAFGELDTVKAYEDAAARSAEEILKGAAEQASSIGVASEIRQVKNRRPAEGILDTAELEDCDLIVMASHGRRGLKKMLIGSQTSEVIALSKRPVLVLR